ncbi:MAG: hypothetical protein IKJ11_00920 [Clostridia bacterium]|nr:hypothetical protein [Clostridia bacterium]
MIDEYFESLVDRWCQIVPKVFKPWSILISNSPIGWRMQLYFGTLGRNIASLFSRVSTEEQMDITLREGSEHIDDSLAKAAAFFREQMILIVRLDERGRSIRFCAALFLMMLSVLGVVATGHGGMGIMSASLCLMWLSSAMECDYAPVSRGVHQQYLAAMLLRCGAITLMLAHYFFSYINQGVPSNVVLQSAMVIMLVIHVSLYLALVMLNTRQPLFLRALAGLTGTMTALTAAAACALCASSLFRPWPLPLSGVMSALGAVSAFLGDELITLHNLGGIRLKYYSIWVCLLLSAGFALMLCGVWTYTL